MCDLRVHIIYHKSESIPLVFSITWVHVYTMSPCLYLESLSIPWFHVSTMHLCLYYESISIPWVNVYTMVSGLYHDSMSIPWVLANNESHCPYHESRNFNYNINFYRITIFISADIRITKMPTYKLHKYWNTNYRNTNYSSATVERHRN